MTYKCPRCGFVMPLHPHVEMTWCPCGWRRGQTVTATENRCTVKARAGGSAASGTGNGWQLTIEGSWPTPPVLTLAENNSANGGPDVRLILSTGSNAL